MQRLENFALRMDGLDSLFNPLIDFLGPFKLYFGLTCVAVLLTLV